MDQAYGIESETFESMWKLINVFLAHLTAQHWTLTNIQWLIDEGTKKKYKALIFYRMC